MLLRHQKIQLITLAVIILFCYSLSAIFQEKVLRRPYGEGEGERFTFAFAFTAVQCIVYASVAKAVITVKKEKKNETPQRFFCIIGVFYVLGKVTSYMSLRYVPYPTSVVGKSAKPIPVMLLGVLIGRKTYTMYKYIFVTIVVIGVALFTYKEKYDKKDGEDPILGIIFIGISLLMDGFLGAFEDRMRSVKKPTPLNLMLFMNSWNSLYLMAYLVTTSEGIEFFQFCYRHPIVIRDLSVVVFFGIFGQFCITSMISYFGALPLSITTTIRKFVTVLLSVMIFDNVLSTRQWIAASIIFIALFLDGQFSGKGKKSIKDNNEEEANGGKECIENGGETVKREEAVKKVVVENEEKCEKINENGSLKNPKKLRKVKVSFEGDMHDVMDEINYAFADSDGESNNNVEASIEPSIEGKEVPKESENHQEDFKASVDENKISTENQSGISDIKEFVPTENEVISQESLAKSVIKQSNLYPVLEKVMSEADNHNLKLTDKIDLDSMEKKIYQELKENFSDVLSDSSDDTKL